MKAILDSRLHVPLEATAYVKRLRASTRHENPEWKSADAKGRAQDVPREIVTSEETEIDGAMYLSVPRGYVDNCELEVDDRRAVCKIEPRLTSNVSLREYQRKLIDAALREETCLWRAGQGAGKTTAALAFAAEVGQATLVVVHTGTLRRQWAERVRAEIGIEPGVIGDGVWEIRPITIGMMQTLRNNMHRVRGLFGALIVDECFEASARVRMADGTEKSIDAVRTGDVVAGGRVTAITQREYAGPSFRLNGRLVTPNHPISTRSGWVAVSELRSSDVAVYTAQGDQVQRSKVCEVRPAYEGRMSGAGPHSVSACRHSPMHGSEVCEVRPSHAVRHRAEHASEVSSDVRCQRCVPCVWGDSAHSSAWESLGDAVRDGSPVELRADGGDRFADCCLHRSDAGPRGSDGATTPGGDIATENQSDSRIESAAFDCATTQIRASIGAGGVEGASTSAGSRRATYSVWEHRVRQWWSSHCVGSCADAEAEKIGIFPAAGSSNWRRLYAGPLQAGLRERCEEDRGGVGRDESFAAEAAGSGCSKDELPRISWLGGAEIPGAGRLCLGSCDVQAAGQCRFTAYNLETESGIYIVEGVVVHNCQIAGCELFPEIVDRSDAYYRLGVSGDERRADGRQFLTYESFRRVACEVPTEELIALGNVHSVEVRIVPSFFRSAAWDAANAKGKAAHASRNQWAIRKAARDREAAYSKLLGELGADQTRNDLITSLIRECHAEGEACIVLSSRREHAERLEADVAARGLRVGKMLGGKPSQREFETTLAGLRAGELQVGIGTYQAIGVGFDLPRLSRGICGMPVANSRKGMQQWKQYRGRFARPATGKRDAVLYYVADVECFGFDALINLERWNDRVTIRDSDGNWVPVRGWIRAYGDAKKKRRDAERAAGGTGDLFAPAPAVGTSGGHAPHRRKRSSFGQP